MMSDQTKKSDKKEEKIEKKLFCRLQVTFLPILSFLINFTA